MVKKTAFVTGVTPGVGEASARALVAKGCRVVGTGRRADRLKHLGQELGAENFLGLAFDLADSTARSDAIVTLIESFANIDLFVNNAGLALGTESAHRRLHAIELASRGRKTAFVDCGDESPELFQRDTVQHGYPSLIQMD